MNTTLTSIRTMIEGILINGLVMAGIYALLATGFSLIFGVTRIINLSHTAFYMLAAYGLYYFNQEQGLSLGVSIAIALVITVIIGVLTYRTFMIYPLLTYGLYHLVHEIGLSIFWSIIVSLVITIIVIVLTSRRVAEQTGERHMTVLLITLAFALIFQESMAREFSNEGQMMPSFIDGYWKVAGVKVLTQRWLALGTAAVLICGLWLILTKTRLGTAIRAVGQDAEVAGLVGINVPRTFQITAGLAAALAAVSGIVIGPALGVVPVMWIDPLIMIMAIVVLGGLGSIKGSVIAAFILAYVEVTFCYLFPEYCFMKRAIAMVVMIIVLMIRPEGLFGITFEEERL